MFTKNVGGLDRMMRIVAGVSLWFAAYLASGGLSYVLAIAGFLAAATGLMGWCGLYALLGRNTCGMDKS